MQTVGAGFVGFDVGVVVGIDCTAGTFRVM